MGFCFSKENAVEPEIYNPDIEKQLAEVQHALKGDFKSMGFPTNVTLRIANMEWFQMVNYRQIAIPPHTIFPNPNTKESILKNYNFESVDKFVLKKNGKTFLNKSPKQIAIYLTKDYNDEMLKARALFRWLASLDLNKVSFDKLLDHQMRSTLLGLKNYEKAYSKVFEELCSYVNIHCLQIVGYAKHAGYEIGDNIDTNDLSLWNVIRINKFWYLCDANFASRKVCQEEKKYSLLASFFKKKSDESVLSYKYDDGYFLPNPEEFIYKHMARNPRHQLLARELNVEEFRDLAYLRPAFFQHKLGIVSHPKCIVYAGSHKNEILISTSKTFPVRFIKSLYIENTTVLEESVRRQILDKTIDPNEHIKMFQDQKKELLIIRMKLPQTATYKLRLQVMEDHNNTKEENDYDWCTDYIIKYTKTDDVFIPPFPHTYQHEMGPNYKTRNHNFLNMFPKVGMYSSTNKNYTEIHFDGDDDEYEYYVQVTNVRFSPKFLQKYCLSRFENGFGHIKFYFPASGEYGINIFGQRRKTEYKYSCLCLNLIEKEPEMYLPSICSYVVTNEQEPNYTLIFPENEKFTIGKQHDYFKLKLMIEDNFQSYQECFRKIYFKIFKRIPCQFKIELYWYDDKENKHDFSVYSFFENSVESVSFHINFPLPGMYKFLIYGKQLNSRDKYKLVYNCYFYAIESDPNTFQFPVITDKWRISESHKIIQPFKKLYSNEKVRFQIQGLKANSMIGCFTNNREFEFTFFNDSWECEIDIDNYSGELIIKAQIYKSAKFFTQILTYKIFKRPYEKPKQIAIEERKEEPTQVEPIQEESIQEEPIQEEPIQEEPIQEEPIQEEPIQEEPIQEEPIQESYEIDIIENIENIPIIQTETIENDHEPSHEIGEVDWSQQMLDVIYVSEFLPEESDSEDETIITDENENNDLIDIEKNDQTSENPDDKEEQSLLTNATEPGKQSNSNQLANKVRELEKACQEKDYKKLIIAINKASIKPIPPSIKENLAKANELKKNMEEIRKLRRRVLKLNARSITELNQYNQPPTVVHTVMKATLLILSISEIRTEEWKDCRVYINYTSSNSMLKKIKALKVLKVHPSIILRADEILKNLNGREVADASAGAAAFYIWCKGNIDLYRKIKKNEIENAQPATKKFQKSLFTS
ncbi:DgyrCDS14921 [Dimorphilus gyrociliatus]|uniref:DgyrCDS14921 n=1 Tax=Dimorphilus gyrociliatus TaxID=2664684 RepID=A0A7I8WFH7_9ANNE|nr:DgyrCDS14921 [Dimorphilus gyrociliatus]